MYCLKSTDLDFAGAQITTNYSAGYVCSIVQQQALAPALEHTTILYNCLQKNNHLMDTLLKEDVKQESVDGLGVLFTAVVPNPRAVTQLRVTSHSEGCRRILRKKNMTAITP